MQEGVWKKSRFLTDILLSYTYNGRPIKSRPYGVLNVAIFNDLERALTQI